ncbi:hypothetical protein [Streptomyces ardesiacus]|uniref:hypothetical protein n=1 Tax=Streptomyces ardesiacus TaxID=285564 RepID=UPI00380F1932
MSKSCNSNLFTRPSKRVEVLLSPPTKEEAWAEVEAWAERIRNLKIADRFGVRMSRNRVGTWDVLLIDRSIPEIK